MAEAATKLPVKTEDKAVSRKSMTPAWHPFEALCREVDHLFDDFDRGFWRSPFRSILATEPLSVPAVDVVENEKTYEIKADVPGMDEKDIEVQFANGALTIKGQKREEKEEKKQDYFLQERRFGSFERSFQLPEGVDTDKIEASFKKGVLTVTLPKTPEAQKAAKKIAVKAA